MIEVNTLEIAEITCGGIAGHVINGPCQLWSDKACDRNTTKNQSNVLIDAKVGSGSGLSTTDIWDVPNPVETAWVYQFLTFIISNVDNIACVSPGRIQFSCSFIVP